ncbi:uncharacterized protein LOC121382868 isoform X2 [Gigantopelta aegis]|uniref:uncharacterized protein LOC121382868 isoform X2 n=1 Tax=Gigantopelta aegis TaxID=1735272 RepID=UPI001B88DCEC|nr:uncharacterized protein LOC121382868 isoform X2 [Gigantopelta aegis]
MFALFSYLVIFAGFEMGEDEPLEQVLEQGQTSRRSVRIAVKKTETVQHAENGITSAQKKKSSAESSSDYRKRIKADPERYRNHLEYENNRVKLFLANLTPEKKGQYQKVTNERVRKWRAEQKAVGKSVSSYVAPKTRKEKETKKEQWKMQKATWRVNRSEEQKAAEKEKRRQKYLEKKRKNKEETAALNGKNVIREPSTPNPEQPCYVDPQCTPSTSTLSSEREPTLQCVESVPATPYKKKNTLNKAVWRMKKAMPTDKGKFVHVFGTVVDRATPRTRRLLHQRLGIGAKSRKRINFLASSVSSLRESIHALRKKRNKRDVSAKKTVALMLSLKKKYSYRESKLLGLNYKLLQKAGKAKNLDELNVRKKRKDALSSQTVQKVEQFYRRSDISRTQPDARSAKKGSKDEYPVARRVMDMSTAAAYEMFRAENHHTAISKTKFRQLRPKDVLPSTRTRKQNCLCEYCANIDLKLEGIGRFAASQRLQDLTYKDRYDLSRSTLCPRGEDGEYKMACLERKCAACGTSAIEVKLRPLLETHIENQVIFFKWENTTYVHKGVTKKKLTRQRKTLLARDFVTELTEEAASISKHLFNARWQGKQYDAVSSDVPAGWVVICQDFAENFSCWYQDEAQGAHWGHDSVTLHANVASYRCPEDDCDLMTNHSLIFVSNDLKHCHDAVHAFNLSTMDILVNLGVSMKKVVYFSDGAPTQYKNKSAFCDLGYAFEDFGVHCERHFFGTRHGKGPCDREFGTLKKVVNQRVKERRAEIGTAEQFFLYCRDHLSKEDGHVHYKRSFFFIESADIKRNRERASNLKPLPQTRQQHCLKMVKPYIINNRERSCFCHVCTEREEGSCQHADITGKWNIASLLKRSKDADADTSLSTCPVAEPIPVKSADDNITPAVELFENDDHPEEIGNLSADDPEDGPRLVMDVGAAAIKPTGSFPLGSWVSVGFNRNGKKNPLLFFNGTVLQTDSHEVKVQFLKKRGNYYSFPELDDVSWVPSKDVQALKPPTINARSQYFFI